MSLPRLLISLVALLSTGDAFGQLVKIAFEGELSIQHGPPWHPFTHVSGPHPFQINVLYDSKLVATSEWNLPGETSFSPEDSSAPHAFNVSFERIRWSTSLRQIIQHDTGDVELLYFDRFNLINTVLHFGAQTPFATDVLINPNFVGFADGAWAGELTGHIIGLGGIDGSISSVRAEWFTPVPEAASFAAASVAFLIVAVVIRRKRQRSEPLEIAA